MVFLRERSNPFALNSRLMTKRAGKKKNRQGVGPLKPPPGPQGPVAKQNYLISGEELLPSAESIAIELQSLRSGWILSADTKIREALITKLLNICGDVLKKPLDQMTDLEINRLLAIFRAVSGVEQRQQQIAIQKALAMLRALNPDSELPSQNVNVAVVQQSGGNQVQDVPVWQAVQRLLGQPEVQAAVKTRPAPAPVSE